MFMEKIAAPACNLFDVESGFYGNGNGGAITGDKPRAANDAEIRAYALFLARRASGLSEPGTPALEFACSNVGGKSHRYCVGATFGAMTADGRWEGEAGRREYIPAQYEAGAFSVLFPGANQMRAAVTFETLGESGEVLTSSTMPIEPKKGGIVWGKDEVRKACGPVAKAKAKRAPTVAKRRAAPTMAEQDKRRRAIMLALKLRAELRRARQVAADRLGHIIDLTRDLHGVGAESGQDCVETVCATHAAETPEIAPVAPPVAAERAKRTDAERRAIIRAWQMRAAMRRMRAEAVAAPDAVPVEVMADIAEAERLIRCEGYDAPKSRKVRAPGHERAIRRAWAERKAARAMRFQAQLARDMAANNRQALEQERERHEATEAEYQRLKADMEQLRAQYDNAAEARSTFLRGMNEAAERERQADDRARLAEQEAAEALAMRNEMRAMLAALERRAEAAEAENAELWAEIDRLTAPATPTQAPADAEA